MAEPETIVQADTQERPKREPGSHSSMLQHIITPVGADIIAAASSIAAGGVTAWKRIKELAHQNISAVKFIEDIKEKRRDLGPDLVKEIVEKNLSPDKAYVKLQDAVKWNTTTVEERMRLGGADRLVRKFNLLRPHQKWDVAISTFAAGGIALGSILILGNQMVTNDKHDKDDKDQTPSR